MIAPEIPLKPYIRAALAAVLSVLLAAAPVRACCDDVLSCAGAVASGGLTCVIELALDALKSALRHATQERDDARAGFESGLAASTAEAKTVLNGWKKAADDAAADAERSAQTAAKLVGDDEARLRKLTTASATMATNVPPARAPAGSKLSTSTGGRAFQTPSPTASTHQAARVSAAEMLALLKDDSLRDMRLGIEDENKKTHALSENAGRAASHSLQAMERSAAFQRAGFAIFLAAIVDVLAVLNNGLSNPLKAPDMVILAVNDLAVAETLFATDVLPAVDRETKAREDYADAPRPEADAAEDHARRAREILAKLERAVRLQTLAERQNVAQELRSATTPAPVRHVRATLAASAAFSTFSKALSKRVGLMHAELQKAKPAGAPDVTLFRTKLSTDLSAQFRGKSAAETARIRDTLLADARRRFAYDPKTLAGVERLVTDAARVH